MRLPPIPIFFDLREIIMVYQDGSAQRKITQGSSVQKQLCQLFGLHEIAKTPAIPANGLCPICLHHGNNLLVVRPSISLLRGSCYDRKSHEVGVRTSAWRDRGIPRP